MLRDNCKNCVSRCEHAGKDREFICVNGISCKVTNVTNAQRIRAMTNEDLTEFLFKIKFGVIPWCDFHCRRDDDYGCHKCIDRWLQQPPKEEQK